MCGRGPDLPLIIPEGAIHFRLRLTIRDSKAELGGQNAQVFPKVVEAGN